MDDRSITASMRAGLLDAELAALVWLLAEGGVPVHVAAPTPRTAETLVDALTDFAINAFPVQADSLAALIARTAETPARLGVVLVLDDVRVVAAHLVRPPLRDAGGHIREQRPAVLVAWNIERGGWEHFAWGIIPELADRVGRKAGDFELEQERRAAFLADLATAGVVEPRAVQAAIAGYGDSPGGPTSLH